MPLSSRAFLVDMYGSEMALPALVYSKCWVVALWLKSQISGLPTKPQSTMFVATPSCSQTELSEALHRGGALLLLASRVNSAHAEAFCFDGGTDATVGGSMSLSIGRCLPLFKTRCEIQGSRLSGRGVLTSFPSLAAAFHQRCSLANCDAYPLLQSPQDAAVGGLRAGGPRRRRPRSQERLCLDC